MSDLEVGLVFLVSATKQNAVLLEQIKALSIYRLMDDDEREQLDDAWSKPNRQWKWRCWLSNFRATIWNLQ